MERTSSNNAQKTDNSNISTLLSALCSNSSNSNRINSNRKKNTAASQQTDATSSTFNNITATAFPHPGRSSSQTPQTSLREAVVQRQRAHLRVVSNSDRDHGKTPTASSVKTSEKSPAEKSSAEKSPVTSSANTHPENTSLENTASSSIESVAASPGNNLETFNKLIQANANMLAAIASDNEVAIDQTGSALLSLFNEHIHLRTKSNRQAAQQLALAKIRAEHHNASPDVQLSLSKLALQLDESARNLEKFQKIQNKEINLTHKNPFDTDELKNNFTLDAIIQMFAENAKLDESIAILRTEKEALRKTMCTNDRNTFNLLNELISSQGRTIEGFDLSDLHLEYLTLKVQSGFTDLTELAETFGLNKT